LDEMKWRGRDIKTNITEWSSEDLKWNEGTEIHPGFTVRRSKLVCNIHRFCCPLCLMFSQLGEGEVINYRSWHQFEIYHYGCRSYEALCCRVTLPSCDIPTFGESRALRKIRLTSALTCTCVDFSVFRSVIRFRCYCLCILQALPNLVLKVFWT
jgi:hypothetical protein